MTTNHNPTKEVSDAMNEAYNHFNVTLFSSKLPLCLIHMHRKAKCYGYFAQERFGNKEGYKTDEIALNPSHFSSRPLDAILSTLVHEMVHLWQHHFGLNKSRNGYHNKEWSSKMKAIGLHPSSTGEVGGKETGQKVSHYIMPNGNFEVECKKLLDLGFTLPYIELWTDANKAKKAASKTKYTCPECGINAWAKLGILIACVDCDVNLVVIE